ncbi:EthD domain-containing protein [uncultured Marinobacter sp.]|uniref:EthD domain-containing protein n=1 Tax=uncultured Marinobacter sp. TaxID=187379 RepID=UPI0030DC40D9
MVKLIFCLHRKPGMSREDFRDYWENQHGPLVQKHASALGIRRYVQSYTLSDDRFAKVASARRAPEEFDGVAELWFESLDDMMSQGASEAGRSAGKALIEDEARFIDLSRSPIWISEEKTFVEPEH